MGLFNKKQKESETMIEAPPIEIKKPKLIARIIGCTLRDDGLKEYLVLANSELGELGEEFEL